MTSDNAELARRLEELMQRGAWADAEPVARQIVASVPRYTAAQFALAHILDQLGRPDEAFQVYVNIDPRTGYSFSQRNMRLLRRRFGEPPPPRPRRSGPAVSYSVLGVPGRFANQLLQYGVTRLYAEQHQLEAEFPDWLGRDIYEIDDPFVSEVMPLANEKDVDIVGAIVGGPRAALAGRDFQGFFCGTTGPMASVSSKFRAFFRPRLAFATRMSAWLDALPPHRTLVALHLRRGDFVGNDRFWIAPADVYLAWLKQVWPTLDQPILYIATDDPAVLESFAGYSPLSAADLGPYLPGAEFLADFHILTQADRLAISNSSFSFVAAMLNEKAVETLRPLKDQPVLTAFDPWNAPVLLDG